jgi:hypothetical protein
MPGGGENVPWQLLFTVTAPKLQRDPFRAARLGKPAAFDAVKLFGNIPVDGVRRYRLTPIFGEFYRMEYGPGRRPGIGPTG